MCAATTRPAAEEVCGQDGRGRLPYRAFLGEGSQNREEKGNPARASLSPLGCTRFQSAMTLEILQSEV